MLATLIISNSVMRVRVLPAARRKIVDISAFKEPAYVLFVAGAFFAFMGLYAPFFYVETYAIQYKITDVNLAFYLLAIINSASVFGRVIPNLVADRTGPLNMIIPCCIISGVLSLCLIPVRTVAPLIVVCALYGFFSGALVSLPPTVFVHLSPNRGLIGTRMGMGFSIVSIGLLLGTPICGWILNGSSFTYVWVFGGVGTISHHLIDYVLTSAGPYRFRRVHNGRKQDRKGRNESFDKGVSFRCFSCVLKRAKSIALGVLVKCKKSAQGMHIPLLAGGAVYRSKIQI